jgi:plasmid stabilization system protein ParE
MNSYSLSFKALDDLTAIFRYVAAENATVALQLSDQFIEKFELLAENPLLGEARMDLEDVAPGIRSFSLHSFVIYYQQATEGIQIGRIARGARDARGLFT